MRCNIFSLLEIFYHYRNQNFEANHKGAQLRECYCWEYSIRYVPLLSSLLYKPEGELGTFIQHFSTEE